MFKKFQATESESDGNSLSEGCMGGISIPRSELHPDTVQPARREFVLKLLEVNDIIASVNYHESFSSFASNM